MAGIKIWYDQEGDMLEVIFEDAPAITEEIADDIFERRTADGRVVGLVVLNMRHHDRESLTLPFTITATPTA
ncbi:MAG: DUF2283 domain-containing protein [Anaerolineae bacterium]|nr:DUF2283 domain-containing protein [Anaerolineae bacterium]